MSYSGQARIAFDTGFNDALFGRPRDNPYDQAVVGKSWQAYEEGYEEGLISDTPPRGPQGEKGDQGDPGPQGPPGADGADGAAGGVTGLSGEVTAGPGVGIIPAVIDPSAIDGQTLVGSIVGTDEVLLERTTLFKANFNQMTVFFQAELNIPTDHTALTSIGVNTHAQIDTHIADTSNPHSTTVDNLDDTVVTAPALNDILAYDGVSDWVNVSSAILGGSNNLDGGASDTNYGGTVGIDGGDST